MEFLFFLFVVLFELYVVFVFFFGSLTYFAAEVVIWLFDLEYEIRKWNHGLSPANQPWLQTETTSGKYWKTILYVDSSGNYFWSRFQIIHKIFKPKLKI